MMADPPVVLPSIQVKAITVAEVMDTLSFKSTGAEGTAIIVAPLPYVD
jgi:hypothetical protein